MYITVILFPYLCLHFVRVILGIIYSILIILFHGCLLQSLGEDYGEVTRAWTKHDWNEKKNFNLGKRRWSAGKHEYRRRVSDMHFSTLPLLLEHRV